MDDLITWLRARLDEDEQDAPAVDDISERYNPARVLADVAAKRAIFDLHAAYPQPQVMARGEIIACSMCGSVDDSPVDWPCDTVKLLAAAYADHPDYREEWRPQL